MKTEKIPEGWVIGRAKPPEKLQLEKEEAFSSYQRFKEGKYTSVVKFCRTEKYNKAACNLSTLWRKYIPEFNEQFKKFSVKDGFKWVHNTKLKISRRIAKNQEIPEGWILGRGGNK